MPLMEHVVKCNDKWPCEPKCWREFLPVWVFCLPSSTFGASLIRIKQQNETFNLYFTYIHHTDLRWHLNPRHATILGLAPFIMLHNWCSLFAMCWTLAISTKKDIQKLSSDIQASLTSMNDVWMRGYARNLSLGHRAQDFDSGSCARSAKSTV